MLVVAWGAQAIVTQSLLLREALVLLFDSEFAWGIVLFAWLMGVAIGAASLSRWDYFRFGVVPEPRSAILLSVGLLARRNLQ